MITEMNNIVYCLLHQLHSCTLNGRFKCKNAKNGPIEFGEFVKDTNCPSLKAQCDVIVEDLDDGNKAMPGKIIIQNDPDLAYRRYEPYWYSVFLFAGKSMFTVHSCDYAES